MTVFQVELVDMHFGSASDPSLDPWQFSNHIADIKHAHSISRGCFFLVSYYLIY